MRAALHFGGSALALALLFHFLPAERVLHTIEKLPARLWLMILFGYLATHCIGASKWRLMVNLGGAKLSVRQAARCYFAGLFGSLFLPSLIGGDIVRAALALRLGRSKAGVLLGCFLDRIVDLAALVLLTGAGALLIPGAPGPSSRSIFLWLGAAALAAMVFAGGVVAMIPVRRLSYRVRRWLVSARHAGHSIARRPVAVLGALSLAISAQLAFIGLSIALAEACGLHLAFRAWLFAWPLAKLSAAIPVTQGGIGVREAALAALLAPFGAPPVVTVAAGLAWEAVVITGALLAGMFSLAAGSSLSQPR